MEGNTSNGYGYDGGRATYSDTNPAHGGNPPPPGIAPMSNPYGAAHAPMMPPQAPTLQYQTPPGHLGVQPWQWLGPWGALQPPTLPVVQTAPHPSAIPIPNPTPPPPPPPPPPSHASNPPAQHHSNAQHGQSGYGGNPAGSGKGPAANAFPGPDNRAYFTKEYMDILDNIKMNKALEEPKKKIAAPRQRGLKIVEIPEESSRSGSRSTDKTEEMKTWVSSTLGDSLRLIIAKLEEVDKKANITAAEKAELELLRKAKAAECEADVNKEGNKSQKDASSSEKWKRAGVRTPLENSPSVARAKPWLRGSSKSRPKRIEISSDDEAGGTVKQNLHAKMENNSELADIKRMLAALMQGIGDAKGKAKVVEPTSREPVATETETVANDDIDLAQNSSLAEEEEEEDEGDLAAFMKVRGEYYSSLHYTRVQELCKEKGIQYFRKDMGVWELARRDLQEYADLLKEGKGEPSSKNGQGTAADESSESDS
ncbi:hypothetical protein CBR_g19641 [Chara braunii]|uniref:Uncharacterized protein n=1 Tax=Chara braunii TaxID=69332 RepID=A0A388KYN0_CHABU|nr:hypothetical protein CBR_g19641 [Chara braunii]|eukprot:GBG75128.1 hypothetical protein CBR_g19641 [Chara braunii]